jgi:hypothetical protein
MGDMAKRIERLTARAVKGAKVGYQLDVDGLYLRCSGTSARSWVYRDKIHDRVRDMGLGSKP